jgi:hypothetical protein
MDTLINYQSIGLGADYEELNDLLIEINQRLNEVYELRQRVIDLMRKQTYEPGANEDLSIGRVRKIVGVRNSGNSIILTYFGSRSNGTLGRLEMFGSYAVWFNVAGEIRSIFWGLDAAKKALKWQFEAKISGF